MVGPGTIGLLVTAALRMLDPDLDIVMVSPDEFGTRHALTVGASRAVPSGPEPALGGRPTMAQVVEWLGDEWYAVDGLVTHTFDLADWKDGLAAASAGPRAGCVKAALQPGR